MWVTGFSLKLNQAKKRQQKLFRPWHVGLLLVLSLLDGRLIVITAEHLNLKEAQLLKSSFQVIYKVGNVRIFVKLPMEINQKQLPAQMDVQTETCHGTLNKN